MKPLLEINLENLSLKFSKKPKDQLFQLIVKFDQDAQIHFRNYLRIQFHGNNITIRH